MPPIADWIRDSEEIKKKLDEFERGGKVSQTRDVETVTRFAFYPNGPLHLGHARTIILNATFSSLNEGKFIFIFDDTDPVKIREKFYEWAEKDLKWLGINPDKIIKVSDDIQLYHNRARELIESGKAYLCNCPRKSEEERERMHRTGTEWSPCEHRENSVEENLNLFERLLQGLGTTSVVKFKMPLGEREYYRWKIVSENPDDCVTLGKEYHDWVMLRYVDEPHPLQPAIKVWPTMHFSVCGFDNKYRISDVIRGAEQLKNVPPQKMLHNVLGTTPPILYTHVSRVSAKYSRKSKIKEAIQEGRLSGWDDPSCFTLRALKRRGFCPEAIWHYLFSIGVPKIGVTEGRSVEFSEENLGAVAKTCYNDNEIPRYTYIVDPIKIKVTLPSEKRYILIGKREFKQYQGRTVYLRELGVFDITKEGAKHNPRGYERGDPFLYWLPGENNEKRTIHSMLIVGTPSNSIKVTMEGVTDRTCEEYPEGKVIRLNKIGYVCIDSQNPSIFIFGYDKSFSHKITNILS